MGILFAFIWPDPVSILKPYLLYLLMIMMFLSSLKINVKSLKTIEHDWWRYFLLLILIFAIPSLIAFFGRAFLSDITFVGLMIVAAAPTAISIVFLSDLLGGNPSKALVSTTLAHMIAPLATPFIVWFFAHQIVAIDVKTMLLLIAQLVLIPFVLAQIVQHFSWEKKILKKSGIINEFLLFILIWATIAPARNIIFENIREFWISAIFIIILLAVQAILGFAFGRGKREKITWVITAVSKNYTLISVLALTLFGPPALIAPAAFVLLSNSILIPIEWFATHKKNKNH